MKKIKLLFIFLAFNIYLFPIYAWAQNLKKEKSTGVTLSKQRLQGELIGGVINKSNLKIGFLNNGRFCAPGEFLPDLPSAQRGQYGYLGKLDLWIGIPDGPWAPKVWHPDSQRYVSLGATVSGSVYEPYNYNRWYNRFDFSVTETDWSTINATKGLLYTDDLLYSEIYRQSPLFDFIHAPTNEYEKTWPRDALTGFRKWPGSWKKDNLTGELLKNVFLGDQVCYITFDDRTYADTFYPSQEFINRYGWKYGQEQGYSIGAEVLAEVIGFQEALLSDIIIYNLKIINTSEWDYTGAYLGIYYESDTPWYSLDSWPDYPGLKTNYIKNIDDSGTTENEVTFPYDLSYSYNRNIADNVDSTYFAVQFLKTPLAENNDGFDNDGDFEIDEPEGEQLGLTGWHFFHPNNFSYYYEREKLSYKILSNDSSGLGGLVDETCFFKDEEGNLDPDFDCPDRVQIYNRWSSSRGVVWYIHNLMSCGPINWESGDTLNFVFGILAADDYDNMLATAKIARNMVDNNYRRSEGPPPPIVTAVPQNGKITLYWDSSAETARDFLTGYQNFEGYKIYRTTSDPTHNDWGERILDHDGKLINFIPQKSCDLINGINGYENIYPFQKLGDDSGLFHSWTDTSVTNGVTYWYSVCSYNRGIVADKNLNPLIYPVSQMRECPKGVSPGVSPNLVKVMPGVQASNYSLPTLAVERLSESSGNGPIEVQIVDPYTVTGHDYTMTFEDTSYGYAAYSLIDKTTGEMILNKQSNTNGEEGKIFDGLQISVQRFDDLEVLNDSTFWFKYETGEPSPCTWSILGGKLNWDPFPFEYEIRFTEKMDTSYYMKKTAPFEIWNTVLNKKSYWDIYYNASTDTTDSLKNTWTSGDMIYIWDHFDGVREFTLRVTITERSYFTYQGEKNVAPEPGDALRIFLKRPFITGDQFQISTKALTKEKLVLKESNKVKVVPNPYIVHAGWELSSNESKIQFINLPAECTIHIFSMAGDQVRTLFHNDINTDYEFWDLLNFSNLKVSYGLYSYVVEIPGDRNQKGKFVILR